MKCVRIKLNGIGKYVIMSTIVNCVVDLKRPVHLCVCVCVFSKRYTFHQLSQT